MNDTMKNKIEKWLKKLTASNAPDEYEAKQFLNLFGMDTPNAIRVPPDSNFNYSLLKPPFAVKVCSHDIMHKTEEKAVLLNIGLSELDRALNTIRLRFPGKNILLEEQVQFTGPEFIIGAINDHDYGTAVMAGAGGIMTEIYQDACFRLAPCSIKEAERMLDDLAMAPILHGYRGIRLDRHGLAEAISAAGRAALCLGEKFNELDINPIVFSHGKWIILDAKIILN